MKPCFVPSTPLVAGKSIQSKSVCARSKNVTHMSAGGDKGEKESLMDWLYRKMMHNSEEEFGYEPFFADAMKARDDEKMKAYAEAEKEGSQN